MTTQQKALAAPILVEAQDGIFFIHNSKNPTPAKVSPYINQSAGDTVALTVTANNNSLTVRVEVTKEDLGKPIAFDIAKKIFEDGFKEGNTATLHYKVIPVGSGGSGQSESLTVRLVY
ncbi:hypothetical protein [Pseudomonas farris]